MCSQMSLRGKYEKDRRFPPQKICFVDKVDNALITLAKMYDLPVLELESNNNLSQVYEPEKGTIYVINEFENNPVFKYLQDSECVWIIGPTYLKESTEYGSIMLRRKSSYCMSMKGMCFHINCPGNTPLMKRMVDLIKWMGGHFVPSPNSHLTHMITTSTRAKGYNYCWTFGIPVLTPPFVEYCWQQRNRVGFKAVHHMDNFILPTFADLYLCFIGFESSMCEKMKSLAEANGGTVVTLNNSACTHMIFSNDYQNSENIAAIPSNKFLVNSEWFWLSLDVGKRISEDRYQHCFLTRPLSESYVYMDVNFVNGDSEDCHQVHCSAASPHRFSRDHSMNITEESSVLQIKDAKKKYNFEELVYTELNYLNRLKAFVDFKYASLDNAVPGGAVLARNVAKLIFGNFEKIYDLHQKLAEKMKDNLREWKNDAKPSMNAIINHEHEILEAYEIYSKNVEINREAYQKCENENKRFKELTMSSTFDKLNLKDAFIYPFQRLCSTYLLLSEMKKNTREKSEDKESLIEAINIIKRTLERMNDEKTKSDRLRMIFNIFYGIENCPNDLVTSHRDFIIQFSAQEITKRTDSHIVLGMSVCFFLFSDVLVVTKLRRSQSPKPYKHIVTLSLFMIVKILLFEEEEDGKKIFGFIIRKVTDENKKTTCCFQYVEKKDLKLEYVLLMIAKQISQRSCQLSADDFIVREIPPGRMSVQPLDNSVKNKCTPGLGIMKLVTQKLFGNTTANINEVIVNSKRRSHSCSELDNLKTM